MSCRDITIRIDKNNVWNYSLPEPKRGGGMPTRSAFGILVVSLRFVSTFATWRHLQAQCLTTHSVEVRKRDEVIVSEILASVLRIHNLLPQLGLCLWMLREKVQSHGKDVRGRVHSG